MKKHFKLLLTITSFVSVLGSLCSCGKSEVNVFDNAFKDTDGVSLTKARNITRDFSPSSERVNDAIVHTTVNSATTKKYIRYAFPVDCVDIEHLSITRTIDSDSKKVTINTVYKKIAYEGKEYFYNPSVNGMLSETDPGNGFYFACYCIEVSTSSLDKNIAANVEADYELGAPIVGATTKTSYNVISNDVSNQATVRFFDLKNKEIEKQIITKGSDVSAPALSDITCWLSNGNVWSSGSTVSSDLDITAHKCKELHLSPAKEATCTGTGYKEHYRCAICQTCYEDSAGTRCIDNLATWKTNAGKINAIGHDFDFANKVVTWNNDVATATAHCINPNCDECVTETKQGFYVKDTTGSCTVHERGHYAVTFNDTRLGNASTEANSIDRGIVHNFGDLIPQVDAIHDQNGMKAHYVCGECHKYFDSNKQECSESDLRIAAPAKHYNAAADMNFDFAAPIPLTETITVDVKFVNPVSDSKICFALFGLKQGGGSDWDNYFGYFTTYKDRVESYNGVSFKTITDDGYLRITIDLSKVDRVGNTNGRTPSFSAINGLYVRGAWSNVEGYIEVNSEAIAHNYGELISVSKTRTTDGLAPHYHCSECSKYFDENYNETTLEELKLKSYTLDVNSGSAEQTLAYSADANAKIIMDIKEDDVNTGIWFTFRSTANGWKRTTIIKVQGSKVTYSSAPDGGSGGGATYLGLTMDGYYRYEFDLSAMAKESGFVSVSHIVIYNWNHCSGKIDVDPSSDYVAYKSVSRTDKIELGNIQFDTYESMTFEYCIPNDLDPSKNTKILFEASNNSKYVGDYGFTPNGVADNPSGFNYVKLDDGFVRVTITFGSLNRSSASWTTPTANGITGIKSIAGHTSWGNGNIVYFRNIVFTEK